MCINQKKFSKIIIENRIIFKNNNNIIDQINEGINNNTKFDLEFNIIGNECNNKIVRV